MSAESDAEWARRTQYARDAQKAGTWTKEGKYATGQSQSAADPIFSNLTKGEAAAKRDKDFGLGANNSAAADAMVKQAQNTGTRFSGLFNDQSNFDQVRRNAADSRGTDIYGGDTSQYNQGLANAANSRGMQTGAYSALQQFAANGMSGQQQQLNALNNFSTNGMAGQQAQLDALNQFAAGPQGPSAAQAQLTQATDANTQNALALARSGRGMGGSQAAMRQAIGQNALTQQQSANQAAELRANENTAFQGQRLNALNAAGGLAGQMSGQQLSALNAGGSLAGQMSGQQLNALNAAGGLASQTAASDQGYGQLGLAGAQYQTDTKLKGTQLNDATTQNWATQQGNATQQGLGAEMGGQTQALNVNSTALAGRENEYASANSTYATEQGLSQAAAIADANRQQAYTGAALSTAGTVIGALSDESTKQNITPLGQPRPLGISTVAPLASQSGGSVAGVSTGPSLAQKEEQEDEAKKAKGGTYGKAAGSVAGGVVGGMFGGPIGAAAGSFLGGLGGKLLGGAIGKATSDVRSKTNITPLSAGDDPYANITRASHSVSSQSSPTRSPYEQLSKFQPTSEQSDRMALEMRRYDDLASRYGASGVAESPKAVARYADMTPKQANRIAREDKPVLSEGDALLADSARSVPGSTYDYKDPDAPGAAPGRQVGPMAQDLAANPLTRNTVGKDRKTGKLFVDTPRLTLYNTAQQHGQQNQVDALGARINKLEGMLKRKPGDERATSFPMTTGGL